MSLIFLNAQDRTAHVDCHYSRKVCFCILVLLIQFIIEYVGLVFLSIAYFR